jgi:DNA invertase Pin-like site-specific DNA recombinase
MDRSKITPDQRQRFAIVYVRQSSPGQVQRKPESTARQYAFVTRAVDLGWPRQQVLVIDEDQGTSANGTAVRSGFGHLTAEVALGHVGIVLGLELSRLARNSVDWYRLFDLCEITDTVLGDDDGLYHPGDFNDRLVLGLKSTMSQAELHILRSRLEGGIRHKAARRELRRGLPVGLVWGDEDGEVRFDPDEAVSGAIRTVFERFAEFGSVRRVWLWYCSEGLRFPHAEDPVRRGPVDCAHLHCHSQRAHQSNARRRLHLRQDTKRTFRRSIRPGPSTYAPSAACGMVGVTSESSPRFCGLANASEYVGANPGQHASVASSAGRGNSRGGGAAPGSGDVWPLRTAAGHLLSWSLEHPRLLLPSRPAVQRPW